MATPPKYDARTGFVTDYGLSVGAKPVQPGDTGRGNAGFATPAKSSVDVAATNAAREAAVAAGKNPNNIRIYTGSNTPSIGIDSPNTTRDVAANAAKIAASTAASKIAASTAASKMAYKSSAAYLALSAEGKDFVDLAYQTIEVGGENEAKQLSSAIDNAIKIADPYFAAQLSLAKAEVTAAIASSSNDYETKYNTIKTTRDRLAQDVAANSEKLTLDQQADLATVLKGYDEDLLSIGDEAANKGLTFATGARSRQLAETRRGEQYQDVVQSAQREYNYNISQLKIKAQRGDEDAAKQLADLEKSNTLNLQKIGRTAETVLGSASTPAITGYTPTGGVIGRIEEDKRKAILSDVGSFMSLQAGFGS